MSKMTMHFEGGKITKTLYFKNKIFSYSMDTNDEIMKSSDKCFETQIEDNFHDVAEELDNSHIHFGYLDFGDESEIIEVLNVLDELE